MQYVFWQSTLYVVTPWYLMCQSWKPWLCREVPLYTKSLLIVLFQNWLLPLQTHVWFLIFFLLFSELVQFRNTHNVREKGMSDNSRPFWGNAYDLIWNWTNKVLEQTGHSRNIGLFLLSDFQLFFVLLHFLVRRRATKRELWVVIIRIYNLVWDIVPHVNIDKTVIGKGRSYNCKSDCSVSNVPYGNTNYFLVSCQICTLEYWL